MIFNNNSTALGTIDIPVAEGYDYSTGTANALIESAINDYNMFKAMLKVDMREAHIINGTDGVVTEGEIISLSEAAAGGIWEKIITLFKNLIAKIKSIFDNFIARIRGLFAKDATLVKKYKPVILAKGDKVNKMKVKFAKMKKDPDTYGAGEAGAVSTIGDIPTGKDREELLKQNLDNKDSKKEWADWLHEETFEDEDTDELSSFGISIAQVINYMDSHAKTLKALEKTLHTLEVECGKLVKQAEDEQKKAVKAADGSDATMNAVTAANASYDGAIVYQECLLWKNKCILNEVSYKYKMYKAVFMKAATVNEKKIEEAYTGVEPCDLIAEAAANEVEDVINGAISKEELSKISNASKNVMGGDVSDDPFSNTYDKVSYYTDGDGQYVSTAGSIDTEINSKKESYDFGAPLY